MNAKRRLLVAALSVTADVTTFRDPETMVSSYGLIEGSLVPSNMEDACVLTLLRDIMATGRLS